jgi:signal transduction histidine kinase
VILSAKEALQRYYDRLTPERRTEHLNEMEIQVRRLTGMLDDVLTINKARAGKFNYRPEPVNLELFCQNLLEQTRLTSGGTGHQFFFQAVGDFSDVVMDTTLLQHIFLNLLGNAVKYSPGGSLIRFDVRREDDSAVFQVIDQGMGIPEADQGHLFEPFFRASNSHKFAGTGLGLTIVQESVQVHGGQITFASQPEQGTTFIVRLPVKPFNRPNAEGDESRRPELLRMR